MGYVNRLRPTGKVFKLDGVEVREWEGVTEGGYEIWLYSYRVRCRGNVDLKAEIPELEERGVPEVEEV